jgi:hypothetical protein
MTPTPRVYATPTRRRVEAVSTDLCGVLRAYVAEQRLVAGCWQDVAVAEVPLGAAGADVALERARGLCAQRLRWKESN